MTRESREEKKTQQSDGLQVYTAVKQAMDVYMVFMQRDAGKWQTTRPVKEVSYPVNWSWIKDLVARKALYRKKGIG